MTVKEALEQADFFRAAGAGSRDEIAGFAYIRRFGKGAHVFYDREESTCLYFLVEGGAYLYKINSLGEKKVIFVYGPGNLLNEDSLLRLTSAVNCEVREDSLVMVLPAERFIQVMDKDGRLAREVMGAMALKIRRLYRQLKNTTNALSGEKRLAAKLFKLGKDYGVCSGDGIMIDMNLSITYLADMLGSKRETVSRQVKRLTELGLINMEKNRITIPDMKKISEYFKQP